MPDRMPDRMPKYMSDRIPDRMPEYMSDKMSEYSQDMSIRPDMSWWGSHEVK